MEIPFSGLHRMPTWGTSTMFEKRVKFDRKIKEVYDVKEQNSIEESMD